MKTLYLIRHAKSSWSFDLDDHDRPLGQRGRKDVLKMGRHLRSHIEKPDLIITSTASRAFYTSLFLADEMNMNEEQIQLNFKLFHSSPEEILKVIKNAPECSSLGICCHNPGITAFANQIGSVRLENVPTCGVVGIKIAVKKWADIQFGIGATLFTYFPKSI